MWVRTSRPLYPNIFCGLIGHPGVGKTRTIREARNLVHDLPDFHLAPVSLTFASLVDALLGAKRFIQRLPDPPVEYNSMYICADELGAFIHKYDNEMIAGLSSFYDPDPYSQNRRTKDLKITIPSPQLNLLAGSTPSNLLSFMPDHAWEQGFTSRIMFIFSDERIISDDFAPKVKTSMADLEHDIKIIGNLFGEFTVTNDYAKAVFAWVKLGQPPVPNHPKLIHYNSRRKVHLYKLSMISAVERSNGLVLTKDDFNRAMGWLLEAEASMPEIFKAGAGNADAQAMEDIKHFISVNDIGGAGVPEHKITAYAAKLIPIHSVLRVIDVMQKSGVIECCRIERTGQKWWRIRKEGSIEDDLGLMTDQVQSLDQPPETLQ